MQIESMSIRPLQPGKPGATCSVLVSIIEDEPDMRMFLQEVVDESGDLRCCDAYCSGEEALRGITVKVPDLVVVDVVLPGISGIECVRRLKQMLPCTPVAVVTGLRNRDLVQQASIAGSDAYLEKPFTAHQFLATLRFLQSQRWVRQKASEPDDNGSTSWASFNERERLIMTALARGLLYKEIASEMGISFSLVHKIQNQVFRKLHARNRTEALSRWQEWLRVSQPPAG